MSWTSNREVSVILDVDQLEREIEDREQELRDPEEAATSVKSTVFSVGKDPRVGTPQHIVPPDLNLIEILQDGLDNPYLQLRWRIPRYDVDAGGVIGFNIFRRQLSKKDIESRFIEESRRINTFDSLGFERLSRKMGRNGKFSPQRKAITQISRDLIPLSVLNSNLSVLQAGARASFNSTLGLPVHSRNNPGLSQPLATNVSGRFERYFSPRRFEKIAFVNYGKFLAEEKQKFVSVKDREFVDLSYRDKKVGYGDVFEYYICSITKDSKESARSNTVRLEVVDITPIRPPTALTVSQRGEVGVRVRVCMDPRDHIGRVFFYRRSQDETAYRRVAVARNVNDCVQIIDSTVEYGKRYSYRVFLINIHGTLSEPREISVVSSVQKITPQSRSNNLKIPIVTAVQDQNSDFIKITISSNDPQVSYYELERRDISINEKKFSVPSRATNYGGDGWESNKFFVDRERSPLKSSIQDSSEFFRRRSVEKEIVFVDDTVSPGHVYQYRVRGCDLFCNPSPYFLLYVKASGKKILRTPINLKTEVVRGSPFRTKVSWNDDNEASRLSERELFEGFTFPSISSATERRVSLPTIISPTVRPIVTDSNQARERDPNILPRSIADSTKWVYKIQRRKLGETRYETFPLTANRFMVDEVATLDAVDFAGNRTNDIFQKQPDIPPISAGTVLAKPQIERPFTFPPFLEQNEEYFYRVAAIDENGNESNFTEEFRVSTLTPMSNPLSLQASLVNKRVRPLAVRVSWNVDASKGKPDRFIIDRKLDSLNAVFERVGEAHIENVFFDKDVIPGNTYIYRVKATDLLGRESSFFETRIKF